MTTATQIQRFSKNIKMELHSAAAQIALDGYTISDDYMTITCDEDTDGGFYTVAYFSSGEEVIAVPDFYLDEEDVTVTGSKGGEYTVSNWTVTKE